MQSHQFWEKVVGRLVLHDLATPQSCLLSAAVPVLWRRPVVVLSPDWHPLREARMAMLSRPGEKGTDPRPVDVDVKPRGCLLSPSHHSLMSGLWPKALEKMTRKWEDGLVSPGICPRPQRPHTMQRGKPSVAPQLVRQLSSVT